MSDTKPRARAIPFLERFSESVSRVVGSSWAFVLALSVVFVWAVTGPLFDFSDTWQLVINTGTTVITFLMVFLIQRSQNKAMESVVLKLNELVASFEGASNRLIDIEDLSERELRVLHDHYRKLAEMSKTDGDVSRSHSIEEAEGRHHWKKKRDKKVPEKTGPEKKAG